MRKFKKNRLKIFIALSLMITTIFGVMFATNSFAKTDTNNNTYYDFNQLVQNGNFENTNGWNGTTFVTENNTLKFSRNNTYLLTISRNDLTYVNGHKYFSTFELKCDNPTNISIFRILNPYVQNLSIQNNTDFNKYNYIDFGTRDGIGFQLQLSNSILTNFELKNYMIIDLTQMFGEGNEPTTTNELNTYFNLLGINLYEYQSYTTSKKLYISNNSNTEYQQLTNNYNEIEENYTQLENDYNDLQDDYDTLQNQYDEINEQYNSVIDVASIGIWDYINTLYWRSNGGGDYELSKQDLLDNHFISGNMLDFSVLVDLYPSPTNEYSFVMTFNSSFPLNVNLINIYVEMSDLKYYDILDNSNLPINFYFQLGHIENNYVANSVQPIVLWFNKADILPYNNYVNRLYIESQGTYLDYYNAFTNLSLGNFMIFNSTDTLKFYSYNTQYQIGYQQGLNESNNISKNYYENIIDTKNNEINSLNTNIEQLERANTILQQQVATSDSYNLNNLIWTIGATPFESFKHIWNVNFFGVNIADFVLGLITFFIGLFIVKKFFL